MFVNLIKARINEWVLIYFTNSKCTALTLTYVNKSTCILQIPWSPFTQTYPMKSIPVWRYGLMRLTLLLGRFVSLGHLKARLLNFWHIVHCEITFLTACLALGIQKPDSLILFSVACMPWCFYLFVIFSDHKLSLTVVFNQQNRVDNAILICCIFT